MFKFENPLNKIRDSVNTTVSESRLPSEGYDSTVGIYGGKLQMTPDNRMIWNNSGIISQIDKWGDAILRNYDEHVIKNLGELISRHPKLFFKFIMPGAKRYRGSKDEILNNIQRLGLGDVYGGHEDGIEIKDKELYRHGIALQDLMRSDLLDSDDLNQVNRFQALDEAGSYLRNVHDNYGAVGEILPNDFIFRKNENGKVKDAVLNLPDIVFNQDKNISDREQKATDILDFIISAGAEEFRRSNGDLGSVRLAMNTILSSYGDRHIIALVKSYLKRGRLTLMGDQKFIGANLDPNSFTTKNRTIFTKHNEARVANNKDMEASLKTIALEICDKVTTDIK
ncbi:MAG: hypothetical protein PHG95_01050 [Patescibacteria group bacterium]|nr:hypothetical protein [Patescibacteria group bacterium]